MRRIQLLRQLKQVGTLLCALILFVPYPLQAAEGLSVSLRPYTLGEMFGVPLTASLITAWVAMVLLIVGAFFLRKRLREIPGKLQTLLEFLIGSSFDYIADTLESRQRARTYFPVLMTIFLFILTMNWVGLLPGVSAVGLVDETGKLTPLLAPPATDLNITIALAIIAVVTIEVAGVLAIGLWRYAGKFVNFSSPLAFVIGLIELVSELARLIAFSFRLFGNIFAGKVLLLVVMFLVTPYVVPIPILAYEVFVAFIQAFIFAILTLFFIKIATAEPH